MKCLIIICFIFLLGCSPEDKYDAGYNDGYAAGYNTTCKIRTTMIEGDWSNDSYKRGYTSGHSAGAFACTNRRN